ncbi:Ctr copper transporter family-domain-containing protein [Mrakia frigida]|uniref:copper transporter family protein n=1 Tax=Mrakia frigida TaxID=29902 RepID=UPI003FCC072E
MDHGGHDMPMAARCSMNMLWNWQVVDTCVIFRSWHITSTFTMILSCLVVALMAFGYELLQSKINIYNRRVATSLVLNYPSTSSGTASGRASPEIGSFPVGMSVSLPSSVRLIRASSYAFSVFISFFLMLVFMSYNGYLIGATIVGAGIGHWTYNREMDPLAVLGGSASKGSTCH